MDRREEARRISNALKERVITNVINRLSEKVTDRTRVYNGDGSSCFLNKEQALRKINQRLRDSEHGIHLIVIPTPSDSDQYVSPLVELEPGGIFYLTKLTSN